MSFSLRHFGDASPSAVYTSPAPHDSLPPASLQEIYPVKAAVPQAWSGDAVPHVEQWLQVHSTPAYEEPSLRYATPVHDSAHRGEMISHLLTGAPAPPQRLLTFAAESESLRAKHGRLAPGPQSTIGFRLVGTIVDEILPWGPAHLSEEIMVHDEILEVDGKPVSAMNVAESIVGLDECNSRVDLTVKRAAGGEIRVVRLCRVYRPLLAIAEDLFETLVKMRNMLSKSAPEMITDLERALDAVSALQIGNYDHRRALLDKVDDSAARRVRCL